MKLHVVFDRDGKDFGSGTTRWGRAVVLEPGQ